MSMTVKAFIKRRILPQARMDQTMSSSPLSSSSLSSSPLSSTSIHSAPTSVPPSLLMTHFFSITLFVNNKSDTTTTELLPLSSSPSPFSASSSSSSSSSFSPSSSSSSSSSAKVHDKASDQSPGSSLRKGMEFKPQQMRMKPPSPDKTLADFNEAVETYFDPIAIGLGILGNVLLIAVFLLTPLKARPLSHVLSGLGIIDFVYVISCLFVHLSSKGQPVYEAPGVCHMTMFAAMMTRSLQTWFMLVAHLDRLNAHFQNSFETRKRRVFNTKFALVVITMLAAALSVHVLWSFETVEFSGRTYCVPMRDSLQYYLTLRKVHVVASIIIPLTIIGGIDLILILKFVLYVACKPDYDDDDEDDQGGGYRCNGESSFCTDKIARFPLHEMKSESCQHILAKGVAGTPHSTSHLSTIKEMSSDNNSSSLRSFAQSLKAGHRYLEMTSGLEVIAEKLSQGDNNNKIINDKKQDVAQYILTLSEDFSEKKRTNSFVDFTTRSKQIIEEKRVIEQEDWSKLQSEADCQNHKETSSTGRSPNNLHPTGYGNRKNKNLRLNNSYTQYSQSMSHIKSYDFTSFASNVSRNSIIPEDHIFPDDIISNSVMIFVSGLVLAALVLPSTYMEAKNLFLSASTLTRPTPNAIQQAILFESLVQLNAVYRVFLYVFALGSFRQAFVWLLTSWIPHKLAGASKLPTFSSGLDKNIVFV